MRKIFIITTLALLCMSCDRNEGPQGGSQVTGGVQKELVLTPFEQLNQGDAKINSHAGACGRSSVKVMKYTYNEIENLPFTNGAYTRIRTLPDGSYILFWQEGLSASDGNGRTCHYALSKDLMTWEYGGKLWEGHKVKNGKGEDDERVYTNANALVLSNGELMAVCSYRNVKTYTDPSLKSDHGILIKRSKDGGRSWYGEQTIYHGPNWEAHLMEVEEGEIHCYFAESRPWIGGSHSGTSLVISKDGGQTWEPGLGNKPHRVMRSLYWSENKGRNLLTDQMAVGVKLNGKDQLAFTTECVSSYSKTGEMTFHMAVIFSPEDGNWEYIADEDETAATCERIDNVDQGSGANGPNLVQFRSGETVATFSKNVGARYYYVMGDENARNWGQPSADPIFPNGRSWGGTDMESTHTMLACIPNNSEEGARNIAVTRMALNHDITATPRTVTVDGDNSEWAATDEALFMGENSLEHATVRVSQDAENIYFLVEVVDPHLTKSDFVTLMLAPVTETGKMNKDAVRIKVGCHGLKNVGRYYSSWTELELGQTISSAYDGTVGNREDVDNGYLVEVAVPRSELLINNGELAFNAVLYDFAVGAEDAVSSTIDPTTLGWKHIKGL